MVGETFFYISNLTHAGEQPTYENNYIAEDSGVRIQNPMSASSAWGSILGEGALGAFGVIGQ